MSPDISARAREAIRLVEVDPRRAARLAEQAERDARKGHDCPAAAIAARAQGLAAYYLRDLDAAALHLQRAVRWGIKAESATVLGEARMSLGFVQAWRGQSQAALRSIEAALADLSGIERARARAQRGSILHLAGRHDEALADYRVALRALRLAGDHQWVQRVLMNRGNLLAHRRAFGAAAANLRQAQQIGEDHGLELSVGLAQHNLGWLETARGDVPLALEYLDRAEACYRALGAARGPLLCDRSQLLLSARLIEEARYAADEAVATCRQERRGSALPEARLLLARVARLQGDLAGALTQARSASAEFGRNHQLTWAALSRVIALALWSELQQRPVGSRLEAAIEASGGLWPDVTLDALITVARSAALTGRHRRAAELLQRASQSRRRGPAIVRSRAWYAEALHRQAAGNHRGAVSAVRAGLRILHEQAGSFSASDLRAHVAGHRIELARLGLAIAVQSADSHRVFEWSERGRIGGLQRHSARPPEDAELAASLGELRLVMRELDEAVSSPRLTTLALTQRQSALERDIRDHQRTRHGLPGSAGAVVPVAAIVGALGDRALVEYVELDARLHAVCLADGRAYLRELGATATVALLDEQLRFAVRQLSRRSTSTASRAAAVQLLRIAAGRLDEILLRPLAAIGDRSMVLVPTGVLQSLPWSVLPSCQGRPVAVAPSAALWYAAQSRDQRAGHALVAAGPNLPGARLEAEAVGGLYGVKALTGSEASVEAVRDQLDNAAVAHLAAHGRVRADNPLFGSLRFADGPLMIYDLEQLANTPHTVVVSACDAGRAIVPVGNELLGLTAALLSRGTTQLIASTLPILDAETAPFMLILHQLMAAGRPAAEALAMAQQRFGAVGAAELATAASFLCFGAGFAAAVVRNRDTIG